MRSPFLIARCVIFALLTYFSLLILVFASWNVHATSETTTPVPGSAILLIFNSCLLFALIAISFAEFAIPQLKTAIVAFECAWMLVLAMFEVGASISLVINGPVLSCQLTREWDVCASSYLLIPSVWLKSFILLGYLFLLLIAGMSHSRQLPSIWCTSIYAVPWFTVELGEKAAFLGDAPRSISNPENDSWARYVAQIANSSGRKRQYSVDSIEKGEPQDIEKAPWAQNADIRRGRDSPFTVRDDDSSTNSSRTRITLPERPAAPVPATPSSTAGSRFIERFRESRMLTRQGKSHFSMDSDISAITPFPRDIDDHDQPIPLPRLSEWMRADAKKGVSVHTIPRFP
ncbi:hypothetical protein CPB85DRAFT_1450891 [Mucidula mucida]|nr:hypothetical protein CPB85DRAFT_1450891 [Mucidula mucida]